MTSSDQRQSTERAEAAGVTESEAKYRALFDSMQQGFGIAEILVDEAGQPTDYRMLEINPQFERLTGQTRAEFLTGRTVREVAPELEEEWYQFYGAVGLTGEPARREIHVVASARWFEVSAFRVGNPEERQVAILYNEITERKQVEEALRESEERYRTLFESMDEAYAVVEVLADENGAWNDFLFHEVNSAFVAQTGMEYPVGRTATDLLGTPNPAWTRTWGRVAETGEPERFVEKEDTLGRTFDLYAFRLGRTGSRRVAVLFTDITERTRHEEQQKFLLEFNDALRAQPDEQSVKAQTVKRLAEHLRLDRCWISEVFEQQGISTVGPEHIRPGLAPMSGVFRLSDYPETMLQLTTQPMVIEDAANDPRFSDSEKELLAGFHLRALLVVPLREGQGPVIWAIAATMATPRQWTEGDRLLLEDVAERAWAAIERVRAEEVIRSSEEKYRSLFESIDEGFCIVELVEEGNESAFDFRFVELNDAFARQTGLEDAAGKLGSELDGSAESHWLDICRDVARSGEAKRFESHLQNTGRWYEVHATRVASEGSQVAIILNDITERKEREERQEFLLKLSDALRAEPNSDAVASRALRMLYEQMDLDRCYIGVFRLEEDRGIFTHQVGNDRVPTLPDEVTLSDFPDALRVALDKTLAIDDVTEAAELSGTDRQNLSALNMRSLIASMLRKGESKPIWSIVSISARPRKWTRGEIALAEEVTERTWAAIERVQAEEQLRQLNAHLERRVEERTAELQDALEELESFNYSVSHDLRAPLRGLAGFSQILTEEYQNVLDGDGRRYLERITAGTKRMGELIEGLLDLSRLSRSELRREEVNLSEVAEEVAASLREKQPDRGTAFVIEPDIKAQADRNLLTIALAGLFENAWKFTSNSENPTIGFGAENVDGTVVYFVRDNGAGFDMRYVDKLFVAFQRLHTDVEFEGTGIGLATVQRIIRRHNGRIWGDGEVGKGATFYFTLAGEV